MSLKEQYIQMKNKNNFSTNWFYKYWLENGGKKISLSQFEDTFFYDFILNERGEIIAKTLKNIQPLVNNIDKKFNLTLLFDEKGQFLKVVE